MNIYLPPKFESWLNLDNLINEFNQSFYPYHDYKEDNNLPTTIDELIELQKSAFIIAKPGYGKSKLLEYISKKHNAKFIDLKDEENIEDSITKYNIFCLDSLDEVRFDEFSNKLSSILKVYNNNPNKIFFISCRINYANNYKTQFREFNNFLFINLKPFTFKEIIEYFKQADINHNKIFDVLRYKNSKKGMHLLRVPRYLNTIVNLILNEKVTANELATWKRINYFDKFLHEKFKTEYKNERTQNGYAIAKRVTEKIALIMEIYQTNRIKKEELITIIDEINSNITRTFLYTLDIDTFIKRVLQTNDSKVEEYVEFADSELQEYQAAVHLSRLGNREQVLFDLVMEPNFRHIYPNWYNVLSYLLEIQPTLLLPIAEYAFQKGSEWIEYDFFELLEYTDPNEITLENKASIFYFLYSYVQNLPNASLWNGHLYHIIDYFVYDIHYDLVNQIPKDITNKNEARIFDNQVHIISYALEAEKIESKELEKWKKVLKKYAKYYQYPHLVSSCLDTLCHFNDISDYKSMKNIFDECTDTNVLRSYINACADLKPNYRFTTEILLKGLKSNVPSTASNKIDKIKLQKELLYIIDEFIRDKDYYYNYAKESDNYLVTLDSNVENLYSNLNTIWNKKIERKLVDFSMFLIKNNNNGYYAIEKDFIKLNQLIQRNNKKHINNFIPLLDQDYYFDIEKIVINLLDTDVAPEFIKKAKVAYYDNPWMLLHLLNHLRLKKEDVFKIGQSFFPEECEKMKIIDLEEDRKKREASEKRQTYKNFQEYIKNIPQTWNPKLISLLRHNIDFIKEQATLEELEKVKWLIKKRIEKTNPLRINHKVDIFTNSKRVVTSTDIHNYSEYIDIADKLEFVEELKAFRINIIFSLFAVRLNQETGKKIFNLIRPVSKEEEKTLLNKCNEVEKSYLYINPSAFANAIKELDLETLIPILKEYMLNNTVYHHDKNAIMHSLAPNFFDHPFLLKIFQYYITNENENLKTVAISANYYLILKYEDKDAIEWRINEIKNRAKKFIKPKATERSSIRNISPFENELNHFGFTQCLIELKKIEWQDIFLNQLLKFSFDLVSKGEEWEAYANYIQKIVSSYHKNILDSKNGKAMINKLKEFIQKYDNPLITNSFSRLLESIEIEFVKNHVKPLTIYDCINKFNRLKAKAYLPIYNSEDLANELKEIIEYELPRFIHHEGFYKTIEFVMNKSDRKNKNGDLIKRAYPDEDHIQKGLKIQIENVLLKRGFRDIDIIREPQLLNDKRPDLLVQYGFLRPISIELKLLKNPEIRNSKQRKLYKAKIQNNYIHGVNASHCIYLIFKVKQESNLLNFKKVRSEYADIPNLIIPNLIDCTLNFNFD